MKLQSVKPVFQESSKDWPLAFLRYDLKTKDRNTHIHRNKVVSVNSAKPVYWFRQWKKERGGGWRGGGGGRKEEKNTYNKFQENNSQSPGNNSHSPDIRTSSNEKSRSLSYVHMKKTTPKQTSLPHCQQ